MKNWIEYLSGNIPGGIGLYVLVMLVLFAVLFGISRRNDLFTPGIFKRWFFSIWMIATVIYVVLWFRDPPPEHFTRYTVQFYSADSQDVWLAYYFRDELTPKMAPSQSATHYFYPQRWHYLAGVDCAVYPNRDCERIAEILPISQMVTGEVLRKNGAYFLRLSFRKNPDAAPENHREIQFDPNQPQKIIPQIAKWIKQYFPTRRDIRAGFPNRSLALAKDAFFRGEYQHSQRLCEDALRQFPDQPEVLKWYHYIRIRQARALRKTLPAANPFETRKSEWQKNLAISRAYLLKKAKENFDADVPDPLLNNMIAESFILEEHYGEAEQFLKIAFGENPFLLEALENFLLLHESRFEGMPFRSREKLMARVLNICPADEMVLQKYGESLMTNLQVNSAPAAEIRARIEKALALNPRSFSARLLEGKLHSTLFEYQQALQSFFTADSIRPNQAVTQYNLGVTYFKIKDLATAEKYFLKAVQLDDYLDAHLYLGVIYQKRNEYEKALAQFRYRVAKKSGKDDYYAVQAMKGIRECLKALDIPIPGKIDVKNNVGAN